MVLKQVFFNFLCLMNQKKKLELEVEQIRLTLGSFFHLVRQFPRKHPRKEENHGVI